MQTLRERCDECGFHIQITHGPTPEAAEEALRLLDLTILDGVGLVALSKDTGAVELRHATDRLRDLDLANSDDPHAELVRECGKILTACGIIVPDEVEEGEFREGDRVAGPRLSDGDYFWHMEDSMTQGRHYTVTITRNPSESPNGCIGKSALQPPVKEEP